MKTNIFQKYLFFSIPLWLISCQQSHRPNVDAIQVKVQIERFDQDFAATKTTDLQAFNRDLQAKYGVFYQDYMTKIIGRPDIPSMVILEKVRNDVDFKSLNAEVQKVYPNMDPYQNELNQTFKYIKYYYPKIKVPKFYTFISGFDVQMPIGDGYVGIGLDMFLGENHPIYKSLVASIPRYISRRFTPQYIVPRVAEAVIREDILPDEKDQMHSMLDYMIHQGKVCYLMQQVLPENTPDSVIFGYTPEQLKWAKNYEKEIWNYFISNKLLFETDFLKFKKYIDEAPYTTGLGKDKESAPKLGVYIGYQIVKKYVAQHQKEDLAVILDEKNAQKILTTSKYKP